MFFRFFIWLTIQHEAFYNRPDTAPNVFQQKNNTILFKFININRILFQFIVNITDFRNNFTQVHAGH